MKRSLSVVYDTTRYCPLGCPVCCMAASNKNVCLKEEPSIEEKLQIVENIAEASRLRNIKIDFSGGEIFTNMEHIKVIERAARLLGADNIGISTSGYNIDDKVAYQLSKCISECEMTMDTIPEKPYPLRPKKYAITAANAIPHLQKYGIKVGIQTVLARSNCKKAYLLELYNWLCLHNVDFWSLLKFYPSGRGAAYAQEELKPEDENWAVRFITNLGNNNLSEHKPKIDFHYTMKGHEKYSNECRCVKKSIGVLPNGDVTACFWAIDEQTGVIDPKFLLGNLKQERLVDILKSDKATYWLECSHQCELKIG